MNVQRRVMLAALAVLPFCGLAAAQDVSLLPADQAFLIGARQDGPGRIALDFKIAPGYILYRDRFAFASDAPLLKLVNPRFPAPAEKFDKVLEKQVAYYEGRVSVSLEVIGQPQPFRLKVQVQGCAVEAGVCYPPYTKEFQVPALSRKGG